MKPLLTKFTKLVRQSPIFRFAILGIIVLIAFWAARLYLVDLPKHERAKIASSGSEMLIAIAEKLPKDIRALPERTEWFPSDLPCGLDGSFAEDPFWQPLGLTPNAKTVYQYRLNRTDEKYTIMARRDSDCDGLFVVHVMNGKVGGVADVTTYNLGE